MSLTDIRAAANCRPLSRRRRRGLTSERLRLVARPLDVAAFAPFGTVIEPEPTAVRRDHSAGLSSLRGAAAPYLSTTTVAPVTLPLVTDVLERHAFSSQSFLPLDAASYLVVVAPDAGGRPDVGAALAFIVPGALGITYHAGVWHHPMAALGRPARFAILMWCDGTAGDEEVLRLPPFEIANAVS